MRIYEFTQTISEQDKDLDEGYYELPKMDKDKYQQRDGLEGPMMTKSGKVLYYDPKEGKHYDPDTDMYMDYEDAKALDEQMSPEQKSYRDSYNTARKDAINNYATNPQSKDLNMHINRSMLKWKRDYALGKNGTGTATINKGVVTKTEEIVSMKLICLKQSTKDARSNLTNQCVVM